MIENTLHSLNSPIFVSHDSMYNPSRVSLYLKWIGYIFIWIFPYSLDTLCV